MIQTTSADLISTNRTTQPLVLIVNSDISVATWIEATLISAGLRAHSFSSAAELLSCFTPEQAACVILDVALPDASGFELQQELAGTGATILFLTHERSISSCVRAFKAGAVDFLTTPCDAADLVQALRYAMRDALSAQMRRIHFGELRTKYQRLTAREREIFVLVASGLLNKQIAYRLQISEITVQIHRSRVMKKMAAPSFASLVRMAAALERQPSGINGASSDAYAQALDS